ncbi:MAG: MinD/ParA family protein [Candidatus Bathyarchaeia archaeon]
MGRVVTIHSNRGGTGKSLLSINLAAALAQLGKAICLLDLDFRAPSLSTIFEIEHPSRWVNDFMGGQCELGEVVIDLTHRYGTEGRFLVGLANPSIDAIRAITSRDRRWEKNALRRLLSMKSGWVEKNVDYAILDASPGVQYSSVNAVACSDIVIVVTTMDALDIRGTRRMVNELYRAFEKEVIILVNKAYPSVKSWEMEAKLEGLDVRLRETFGLRILVVIPCYCDILRASRMSIYTLERPDHPFSKAVFGIAEVLLNPNPRY